MSQLGSTIKSILLESFDFLKVWRVHRNFRNYLETVHQIWQYRFGAVKNNQNEARIKIRQIRSMMWICVVKMVHFALLALIPLSEFGRVLNYDLMLFYRTTQKVNLTHALLATQLLYFWHRMYFCKRIRSVRIVQKVIYEGYTEVFAKDRMMVCKKFVSVNRIVAQFTNAYLSLISYFSLILGMYSSDKCD